MRRREFEMPHDEALALLTSLPTFHLASSLADGTPVFRTLHGVVDDGWVAFHSAPKGEKTSLIGRDAVLCSEDSVATVPSTFFDPIKACPATTYYRSVQVRGVVEEIEEPARKARILQGLMEKLQPEGGYRPIAGPEGSFDPMYRAAVNGLLVAGIRLEQLVGKAKLAQNRAPRELAALLTSLWDRGAAGDLRALELIRAANPQAEVPAFLEAPAGLRLHVHLGTAAMAGEAAALVLGRGGAGGLSLEALTRAHLASAGWVGASLVGGADAVGGPVLGSPGGAAASLAAGAAVGSLVATGRIVGDGVTCAHLCDLASAPGAGASSSAAALAAVTRLLRAHPAARHVDASLVR